MLIEIILLQLLFALGIPLNKALLAYCSFLTLAIIRLFAAGLILIGCHVYFFKDTAFYKGQSTLLAKKIIFGSFLKYTLKYWGLQFVSTAHMAFLLHTTPLWTGLLDYLCYNTKLNRYNIAGIMIGFIGSIPLLLRSIQDAQSETLISLPACAIMIAIGSHSYGVLCTKELVTNHCYSPFAVASIGSLGAGILALILALGTHHEFHIRESKNFGLLFVLLILINNVVGKSWHTKLLQKYNATFLACSDYLYPIIISTGSYIATGELPDSRHLFAFLTTIIGLSLFRFSKQHSSEIKW